jgi:predicted CoA-binding protein
LAELTEAYDLVDVFRRPDALPAHQAELAACAAPVVWFQLGIRHDTVAAALTAAGKTVIQDRCTLADHRRLGLGAPSR